MLEQVGRNIFSLGLSRIISGIIIFVVYIRLVTYLGPADFGKFSLVLAYYIIVFILMDLGVSRFITKRISPEKELAGVYLGNHLVLQFLVSLLVLAFFILIPRILQYEDSVTRAMLLVGIGLMVGAWSIPFRALADVWQRLDIAAAVNFLNTVLVAGWMALTIFLKKDFVFVFWIYIIVGVMSVAIYMVVSRRWALPKFDLSFGLIRSMVIFGLPFALIAGFEMLVQKVDVIIQKFFLPFQEVGYYSAAYRFLDFLTFIPAVVALSLFPYLAAVIDLKKLEVSGILNRLNRYLVILAVPLGIGGTVFAPEIVATLFQEQYAGAVLPFQILIWASALTFLYGVPNVIMLLKKTKLAAVLLGSVTVFNALANWFLIPRGGIVASAWITVISYILLAGSYIFFAKQEANFSVFRYFPWPALASAFMVFVMMQVRGLNFYLLVLLGGVVYFGALFLVRFLRSDDLGFLKSIFQKQQKV